MHRFTSAAAASCLVLAPGLDASAQPAAGSRPIVRQDAMTRVSEHVYVIPDEYVGFVPNVGIVVGERATLIVDTGLGERNGEIVLGEARKVADSDEFYVAATHFHPEHDLGATAFPASARVVRWSAQQAENEELGAQTIERFSGFSPIVAELLEGAEHRAPDIVFEEQITLDLGGVQVRITGVGPNHTRGDTVFFVEDDRVLFTGDVVMSTFPSVSADYADLDLWLENLDAFEALDPVAIVPAHGRMGGAELIRRYREYLTSVREAVAGARGQGRSPEDVSASLAEDLAARFVDLEPPSGPQMGRIDAAIRAAWREEGG
ncbi:MAG: MBL fold metallo-hydrolase [Gammaproteobacteria bacterium]|nr:MBL fold metallo-hydrolase [Gammaproteobacteria bacterium]